MIIKKPSTLRPGVHKHILRIVPARAARAARTARVALPISAHNVVGTVIPENIVGPPLVAPLFVFGVILGTASRPIEPNIVVASPLLHEIIELVSILEDTNVG